VVVFNLFGINLDISLLCNLIQTVIAVATMERGNTMKSSISNLVVNGLIGVSNL